MDLPRDEAALRRLLAGLREELEELEEEQMFTLSQTGLHVTGGERKRFEADLSSLRERIRAVEKELAGFR
ncbi:MAG: hypothetical protein M0Z41_12625 [Peptococcaceae bacterium]|jgi:hypothetical protein|nr:hypothetical protein [Peptococcaceae bacterium]